MESNTTLTNLGKGPKKGEAGRAMKRAGSSITVSAPEWFAASSTSVSAVEGSTRRGSAKRRVKEVLEPKAKRPRYLREFLWREDDETVGTR
jgi:hypothetical protein